MLINKLQEEKASLKSQLQKFKGSWHNLRSHFHKRITYDNDPNYKIVSDDLYRNGIFDDNDNEIANNILRKVTISDENKNNKLKKKNDIQTYKEIVAFTEGKKLDELHKAVEVGKRPYQNILKVIISAGVTAMICFLIGVLMHVFLN